MIRTLLYVALFFGGATHAQEVPTKKVNRALTPYSQTQCQKEGPSSLHRSWMDLQGASLKFSIRFQAANGTIVTLESNSRDGEGAQTYTLDHVDCRSNSLVVDFQGWESHRKILYSTNTGKETLSASKLMFSPDRTHVLATTPSDYNVEYQSELIQLYKLNSNEAKVVWEMANRKLRFDLRKDGEPIFGKDSVKFLVRQNKGKTPIAKENEEETSDFGYEIDILEISCSTKKDSPCTEKIKLKTTDAWSPG